MKLWKRQPAIGIGIGVGLAGAIALAIRARVARTASNLIPDGISPAIFATRVAQTRHGEMIYHISGSGRPVVFLHGVFIGASSYEWSKVYPRFALNNEVVATDLIGFGESQRPSEPMDAEKYVESLADFLGEISRGLPPVIVASGLTAGMALLLAAKHPELVSRLVLFLPTSLRAFRKWRAMGLVPLSGLASINRFVYRNYLARAPFIRNWLTRFALANPESLTEEMVSILATCAQQYGAEHALLGLARGREAFDVESRLADILAPVHILWPGAAPAIFVPSNAEALCSRIPQASMDIVPGCGLLAALESPDLMASALSGILDGPHQVSGAA